MPRSIVAGARYRPAFRSGPLEVEGPDEDGFTLAVAAAERLLDRTDRDHDPIDSIHLVGTFPAEADGGMPEVLGVPHVVVHRHGAGPAGLGAALLRARDGTPDGASLVLVAEVASPSVASHPSGAGAVALELREAPGLAVLGQGGRRHPAQQRPDGTAWSQTGLRAGGLPDPPGPGHLLLVAREAPPVLLAVWTKTAPRLPPLEFGAEPEELGPAGSLPSALAVQPMAESLSDGGHGLLAVIQGEETRFLGFRRDGAVRWDPAWSAPRTSGRAARERPVAPVDLNAVSEGAYIPRATYLENLPSRWRFVGTKCSACGAVTFPSRGWCRSCRATRGLEAVELPRSGTVEASTRVSPGAQPTEFDPWVAAQGAYGVVLVSLAPGVRVTLQVTEGPEEPLPVGSRVDTSFRRLYPMEGEWRYGRKAVPSPAP